MCQAKRDGGRRCAAHLQRAAQTALAGYAAHLAGLTRTETLDMLTELRDRNTPTPTRGEVDGFLEAAARQVDADPTLPADRRGSLAARLRAAVGRVLPDGATFHAWRALLAAAWARARRGLVAAGLAAGLAATAAGCSAGPPAAVPSATATPTASATPTATPTPTATAQGLEATPTLSADVVGTFGAQRALQGVAFAREALQTAMGMIQLLGPGPHPARDYEPIRPYLTASAWDGLAKAADAGDPKDQVAALVRTVSNQPGTAGTLLFADGSRLTPGPIPPNFPRLAYSAPEVSVERSLPGQPRLLVMVHTDATYTGTRGGAPATGTDHLLRYYALLPTGAGGWLVDAWANRPAPN